MKPESKASEGPRGKKKAKGPKKKTKKDPNEPQKPISAYALFFRDTQAVIKRQNTAATFGEVSKIVASMWDSLDPNTKNDYKERTEEAKKEYLEALAAYRASLVQQDESNNGEELSNDVEPSDVITLSSPNPSSPQIIDLSPEVKAPTPPVPNDVTNPANETPVKSPKASAPEQKSPEPVITISSSSEEQDANEESKPTMSNGTVTAEVRICLRSGCTNPAIDSLEWDQEYCSSKCVVEHCSNVFMAHVAARQKNIIELS